MSTKRRYFQLIDPLNPSSLDQEFGHLADVVAESVTWLFYDPIFDGSSNAKRLEEEPSLAMVNASIDAARNLLAEDKTRQSNRRSFELSTGLDGGKRLVDLFCNRVIQGKPAYEHKLSTGRTIGQRQILCAVALLYADKTALAIREGRSADVCNLMWNLLELIDEIRRALDREAGSDIAVRRARQRWEKIYRLRALACEKYDARKWRSARQAARMIYTEVIQLAERIEASLSADRGEQTVYEWLLAHKKATSA